MSKIYFRMSWAMAGGLVLLMSEIGDHKALFIALVVFTLNCPFGIWRGRMKFPWKLIPIHMPIPIIWLIRDIMNVELSWVYILMAFPAALLGQRLGEYLFPPKKTEEAAQPNPHG